MPTSLPHEIALGAVAALIVGGISWWASYVTQGAGGARKLAAEFKSLASKFEDHLSTHEATEERMRDEIASLRDDVAQVGKDVSAVHGELKGLVTILVQNGVRR